MRKKPVSPSQSPSSNRPAWKVVLYTRIGCHLCDDAEQLLLRMGLRPEKVDVDSDVELQQRYTDCVPVVTINGRERFRGRVNEVLLKRLIAQGEG